MIEDLKKWAEDLAARELALQSARARVQELESELTVERRERVKAGMRLDLLRKASGTLNGIDEALLFDTHAIIEWRRSLMADDQVIIRGRTRTARGPTTEVALGAYRRNVGET